VSIKVVQSHGPERDEWMRRLDDFENSEVFAHPGYLGLFDQPGHNSVCLFFECDAGRAMYPITLRDLRCLPYWEGEELFDALSPPYGYGGPFVDGDYDTVCTQFFAAYNEWANDNGLVSEYITFSAKQNYALPYPGDVVERMPCVVRATDMEQDPLWMDYKGSVRTDIKNARRQGVTVEVDTTGQHRSEFLAIYESTMDRRQAAQSYRMDNDFLARMEAAIPGYFSYFHARHEGEIVSTELVLISGDSTFFFRGGTFREKLRTRANLMLKHEIIEWSRQNGKRFYLLGAGNSETDALFKYKRAFSPRGVQPLRVGKWAAQPEACKRLEAARSDYEQGLGNSWTPRTGFFPAYRAPGAIDA